jgi:hypothetical protein
MYLHRRAEQLMTHSEGDIVEQLNTHCS